MLNWELKEKKILGDVVGFHKKPVVPIPQHPLVLRLVQPQKH